MAMNPSSRWRNPVAGLVAAAALAVAAPACGADPSADLAGDVASVRGALESSRSRLATTGPDGEAALTPAACRRLFVALKRDALPATLVPVLASGARSASQASSDGERALVVDHLTAELAALEAKLRDRRDRGLDPLGADVVRARLTALLARLTPPRSTGAALRAGPARSVVPAGATAARGGPTCGGPTSGGPGATSARPAPARPSDAAPAAAGDVRVTRALPVPEASGAAAPRPAALRVVLDPRATSRAASDEDSLRAPLRSACAPAAAEPAPRAPWALCLLLCGLAAGGTAAGVALHRRARASSLRARVALDGLVEPELAALGAGGLAAVAQAATVERDWLRALRYRMAALLVELEAWDVLRPAGAATNRELALGIRAKGEAAAAFGRLAAAFDAHWYGRQPVTEADWLQWSTAADGLRSALGVVDGRLDRDELRARAARLLSAEVGAC